MSRKITDLVPEVLLLEKISPSLYFCLQTIYSQDKIFGDDILYKSEYEEGMKEILLMIVNSFDFLGETSKKLDLIHILNRCITIMNNRDFHASGIDNALPDPSRDVFKIEFNEDKAKFQVRAGKLMSLNNGEIYLLIDEFGDVDIASTNISSFFTMEEMAKTTVAILNSIIVTYVIIFSDNKEEKANWNIDKDLEAAFYESL